MGLKKKKIGEILIENNYLTSDKIETALKNQEDDERLGDSLIRLGMMTEDEIANILSKQTGISRLDMSLIEKNAVSLLTEKQIFDLEVIPICKQGKYLLLGVVDPLDVTISDKVKKILNIEILERVITKNELEEIFKEFHKDEQDFNSFLEDIDLGSEEINEDISANENSPIINIVNKIINEGLKIKASDIHIEPQKDFLRIRYRVDGVLHEKIKLPLQIHEAILLRIKIMSELDISEKMMPQDGKINLIFAGKSIDFRISTLPSINGEKAVVRILDKGNVSLNFKSLGFVNDDLDKITKMMNYPHGMILATGPTGSGKTTTLYTILKSLNTKDKNIITIEDPVEYQIEGITQVPVNKKINFVSGLRSIVRQDPDIIMIGEIRDKETAEIAIQAALTGHLVLSTLHTNTAVGTISRLINMGVEPFLVASSLIGVISQRLIRTLCDCKIKNEKNNSKYSSYKEMLKINKVDFKEENLNLFNKVGCELCNEIGFKGRTTINEILIANDKIKEMISKNKSLNEISKVALENGMKTLEQSGIEKTNKGITSFEEIQKATML